MSEEKIFEIAPGEKMVDDRSRLAIFFGVLGRKFWKLMSINLMYMLFNIPAIILGLLLSVYMMGLFMPTMADSSRNDLLTILFVSGFPTVLYFMAVPAISVGPAQAGLTYLMRCYSYELPTFNWSDFKDKMKENFKQGMVVSIINFALLVFFILDLYLYSRLSTGSNPILPIAHGLLIMVFVLFLMMNLYIYPMMVSYSLKIKDIYKNAFIFAFARFIPNLAVLFIVFLLILGPILLVSATSSVLVLTIAYTFYFVFGFSLTSLVINFFVNPVLDKHLNQEPNNKES